MNILLTSLMVPGAPSGVRVHYERLAELLRQEGHTVTLVTQDSLRPLIRRAIGGIRRTLKLLLGNLGEQIGIEVGSVAEIYFAIDRKAVYDVVNSQDVSSGLAARLALRDKVPVVVTGHFNDHPAEELVHQRGFKGLTARFLHRWYNFLLSRTRNFIGVSEYVLRRILPWLPTDNQHAVVYNGVSVPATPPTLPTDAPNLRALFPNRPIVLNVGQLEPRKNQRYLVQVAAELRTLHTDFVLVLVGKGEDEAVLRQQIAAAGLEQHVVLLGYHRHIMELLRDADLYVHAATRENCPLVLLEAMAVGCPAVALTVGGIPELLAPTPQALIAPTTPPATLARQLRELLSNATALAHLQQKQRAFGAQHFSAQAMLNATLDFFEQVQHSTPTTNSSSLTSHSTISSYTTPVLHPIENL